MVDVLELGPLMIRWTWLYLITSAVIGFWVMKVVLKRKSPDNLPIIDALSSGLILAIIIWKISPAFTELSLLNQPLSLIMYPGTPLGIQIAIAALLLYTAYAIWRSKLDWQVAMDTLAVGWLAASFVYLLSHWQYGSLTTVPWGITLPDPSLRYHPINVYILLLMIPLVWVLRRLVFGQGRVAYYGFIGYGVIVLLISWFESKMIVSMGLSKEQIIAVSCIAIGFMTRAVNYFIRRNYYSEKDSSASS
ncbi:prolipoprotein diacylglyceryl transferase [Paenibacillus spongiae]|uniref:Prolipoprotein diacylglyceryl transferase n=1 Tax=Paenibacillus spongiae TaxID=2909671 RepID=A0ABY5SIN6_9BACL|nr:prolipoprotein diacylglyceryl transferase [Paenibacillus spongiae]UVI33443.1 prolipoprotein diacylglyceryl transferase [Paenibacillus spongiae]